MYILWTILYLPLTIYHYLSNEYGIIRDAFDFIRGTIFIGEHYNSYALWYLLSCIYGLAFIRFLFKRNASFKKILIFSNLLMLFGFIFTELVTIKDSLPGVISVLVKILWVCLGPRGRIFMGVGYISIGMFIAKKDNRFKSCYLVFIAFCGFCATFLGYGLIKSIGFVLFSCGFFSLVLKVNLKNGWQYEMFRNCSVVMYFVHLYVWTFYYTIRYGEKTYGLDCFAATIVVSLALGSWYSFYCRYRNNKMQRRI